jgi:hypothetical protein
MAKTLVLKILVFLDTTIRINTVSNFKTKMTIYFAIIETNNNFKIKTLQQIKVSIK